MFALLKFTNALLKSFNVRAEIHGTDPVPAGDIGLRITGSNKLLDLFDLTGGLRHQFYRRVLEEGEQENPELEGIDPVSDTPVLRNSMIDMPIHLGYEFIGRNVVIDYGLGGKSNIEIACDLNNFKVDMKDGGSVDIDFRVQVSGLEEKTLGKLGSLVKHDIKITIASSTEADNTQEKIPLPKVHIGEGKKTPAPLTPIEALAASEPAAAPKKLAAKKVVAAKKVAKKAVKKVVKKTKK